MTRCSSALETSAASGPGEIGPVSPTAPSRDSSFDTLPWLHEQRVTALASDNWAVEAIGPGADPSAIHLPLYAVPIVQMGLMLGELLDLDALAYDWASDRVYEFLFLAAPLPLEGAVGAPVNPLVLK